MGDRVFINTNIHRISFWDAMIVAAAYSKNADIVMTEDMAEGEKIEGTRIVNPL